MNLPAGKGSGTMPSTRTLERTKNSGTAALGFPLIGWRMVDPVLPAISTKLLPFLLPALFLLFALFATITHGRHSSFQFLRGGYPYYSLTCKLLFLLILTP